MADYGNIAGVVKSFVEPKNSDNSPKRFVVWAKEKTSGSAAVDLLVYDFVQQEWIPLVQPGSALRANVVGVNNTNLTGLSSIDNVSLTDGKYVLLIGQTDLKENGLYIFEDGDLTRPTNFTGKVPGDHLIYIVEGSHANSIFYSSNTSSSSFLTIDTDNLQYGKILGGTGGSNGGVSKTIIVPTSDSGASPVNYKTRFIAIMNNLSTFTVEDNEEWVFKHTYLTSPLGVGGVSVKRVAYMRLNKRPGFHNYGQGGLQVGLQDFVQIIPDFLEDKILHPDEISLNGMGEYDFGDEILEDGENFSQETFNRKILQKIATDAISQTLFNQHSQSSTTGDTQANLLQPDYGITILETTDVQDGSSYKGEIVMEIENNEVGVNKELTLFGATVYDNTNPSSEIQAKVTFSLDFFNQDGNNIDYKIDWQYFSSGEILFGSHNGTVDNTSPVNFPFVCDGGDTDVFKVNSAKLQRVCDAQNRVLSAGINRWNERLVEYAREVNKSAGNSITPYIDTINTALNENDGEVYFLTYQNSTTLRLRISTVSGDDIEIDWEGNGNWEQFVSDPLTYRVKTFGSATSGVALIRSAVGNPKYDIFEITSNLGAWNFDMNALKGLGWVTFVGNSSPLSGDISNLSSVTSQVYISGTLVRAYGDISNLTTANYVRFVGDNIKLTGDISAFSNLTDTVYFQGNNMYLTGNISALSNVEVWVRFQGNNMLLTGDISSLSSLTGRVFFLGTQIALTGDVGDLPNGLSEVYLGGSLNTLTGDLSSMAGTLVDLTITGTSNALTYTSTTWPQIPTTRLVIRLEVGKLTQTEVDNLLIDLEATGDSGTGLIELIGNNAAPSAASASAISALQSRGWTVTTN